MKTLSAKSWFDTANGKMVEKTISGALTLEDWPEIIESYRKQLKDQGLDSDQHMIVTDNAIEFSNGQFVILPKMKKTEVGVLIVRSADYILNNVHGSKKGAKIVDGNLVKTYPSGMVITFRMV